MSFSGTTTILTGRNTETRWKFTGSLWAPLEKQKRKWCPLYTEVSSRIVIVVKEKKQTWFVVATDSQCGLMILTYIEQTFLFQRKRVLVVHNEALRVTGNRKKVRISKRRDRWNTSLRVRRFPRTTTTQRFLRNEATFAVFITDPERITPTPSDEPHPEVSIYPIEQYEQRWGAAKEPSSWTRLLQVSSVIVKLQMSMSILTVHPVHI